MTKIEWTEATWNPIVGCSIVSPGCTNCYAMRMAARLEAMADRQFETIGRTAARGPIATAHYLGTTERSKAGPVWTGKVALAPDRVLTEPLRRRKPTTYFVNSMGDLFHEAVPDGWIMSVLDVMFRTPQHTYQVLTKRSARMRDFMLKWGDLSGEDFDPKMVRGPDETRKAHPSGRGQLFAAYLDTLIERSGGTVPPGAAWPTFDWAGGMIGWPRFPANVWLGVSAERQAEADARIPHLLATPAAVRFVSAEPLLGPIDLTRIAFDFGTSRESRHDALSGVTNLDRRSRLDWVIAGGESGPGARPMHPGWARGIRDQCTAAGVPFFFKQWGEWLPSADDVNFSAGEDWARRHFPGRRFEQHSSGHTFVAVGKGRAGRLLDGRLWDEVPQR